MTAGSGQVCSGTVAGSCSTGGSFTATGAVFSVTRGAAGSAGGSTTGSRANGIGVGLSLAVPEVEA